MPPAADRSELGVLTLNLARPNRDHAKALLEYLWGRPEQLLVLTEAGSGAGSALICAVFREAGDVVLSSVRNPGELGVILVGRDCGLEPASGCGPQLMPHRVQLGRVGRLHVAGVYGQASDPVRYASKSQRQRKRDWLVAYREWLAGWVHEPSLIVGDLNIVDPQLCDRLPYVLPEEVAAYRWMIDDLGLIDGYRTLNPPASSWQDHSGVGCRYDHGLVTPSVTVVEAGLDQGPRTGLTDHAALHLRLHW